MKARCMAIALAETPEEVTYVIIRRNLSGHAWPCRGEMAAPRPYTRKSLYYFLHEIAHFKLGHDCKNKKPTYEQEYEAEIWAHRTMRGHGLAVPKSVTNVARRYVGQKILRALDRGLKKPVPRHIAKFTKSTVVTMTIEDRVGYKEGERK